MFDVGEQVICIDDRRTNFIDGGCELVKGRIYTIEWIGMYDDLWNDFNTPSGPLLCVHVVGVKRVSFGKWDQSEVPFAADRFAPLRKANTDISVFTTLLNEKVIENV